MSEDTNTPPPLTVGATVRIRKGSSVTRPDGSVHQVVGRVFVLDAPGVFVIDGTEVTVQ